MPYWPYGWPKTLVCATERSTEVEENWVYVHQNHGYLLAISDGSLQLWSAGQHKLRLCCHTRTDQGLQAEGHNLAAFWNGGKGLVAVLTSKGFLHIYSIYVSKDALLPGVPAARDLCKADIYLRHTVKLEQEPTCITGDSKVLLIGFADGTLATAAWSGKIRDVVYPLPAGDWHELQAGLQQQHYVPYPFSVQYCEKSRALVMVLSDGSCALLGVPSAGLSFLHDLAFSHWVCSPSSGATCASIGASAQMVAVGCSNGQLELYRLQPSAANSPYQEDMLPVADTPVRVLSLESWGHRRYETGGISKVQWSPDSRAIAVGYQTQGLVVWSPSGCRLLCTLRQVPNTFGRDSARRTNSGGAAGAGGGGGVMGPRASSGSVVGGDEGTNSSQPSPRAGLAAHRRFSREQAPPPQPALLEAGVAALAWGLMGYTLLVAHTGCGWQLVELQFAHSLPNHHRVAHAGVGTQGLTAGAHQPQLHRQAGEEELHVLQAHDRLLIVAEAIQASNSMGSGAGHSHHESRTVTAHEGPDARTHLGSDLLTSHMMLPQQYIASNWPVVHVAVSSSGIDMAVAGQRGLALYSRLTDRWRLFGDVSQERRISCRMLCWMESAIIVCSGPPVPGTMSGEVGAFHTATTTSFAPSGYELLLFPRYHLDFSSLLCRIPLSQPPLAVDCVGQHILVASEPLEIALFKVQIKLWFPSLLGKGTGLKPVGSDSISAPSHLRGLAGLVTTDSEQPGAQNDMELEFDQEAINGT
ncbi:hypothetical protein DUNSADRAFT_17671 [Dunaliella salina]|uniref:Anaphase-promoting complex subunit 4 WD40 domain-containing protein n=1 Tax=Dunaliella salina TaxID=3046 RepID=A0ABQ7G1D8_DUNSA|nr:hypothetical protein DUNSADRAFT_17671 [Dunaliella salina]|eukprot:KAF5828401.1 hypothetical protein DUNSADRAFT_17671 [Dunaliella salina]